MVNIEDIKLEDIKANAPYEATHYKIQPDNSVGYYRWKNNEGWQSWIWGWLGVNVKESELKYLYDIK